MAWAKRKETGTCECCGRQDEVKTIHGVKTCAAHVTEAEWDSKPTQHSADCKMVFGRKDPNCPRCQELLAGANPREWGGAIAYVAGKAMNRRQLEQHQISEIAAHYQSHKHLSGGCGPVCTFGEW